MDNIKLKMDSSFTRLSKGCWETYTFVRDKYDIQKLALEFYGDSVDTFDVDKFIGNAVLNTDRFQDMIIRLMKKCNKTFESCNRYAGTVKAVLDILGIKSNIMVGFAVEKTMVGKLKGKTLEKGVSANHVWVIAENNQVYERNRLGGSLIRYCGINICY